MENTRYQTDQVHVLRQGFRPNEPLNTALGELVKPSMLRYRLFSLYSSDERTVEIDDVTSHEFSVQKYAADKYLKEKSSLYLKLGAEISARVLTANKKDAIALQLVMRPPEGTAYRQISEALDIIEAGERSFALGFEATRLYMNLPVDQLRSSREVKENIYKINDIIQSDTGRHLYQISSIPHLLGRFVPRIRQEPEDQPYPEDRAS